MSKIIPLPLKFQLCDKWKFIFYALLILVVFALASWLPVDIGVSRGMMIGCACGIYGHYKATRVSGLTMPARLVNVHDLDMFLHHIKYEKIEGKATYQPMLHRLLRFDAHNVSVERKNDSCSIIGPMYILRKLMSHFGDR